MLKINLVFITNIKFNNSKTRINKINKKINYVKLLFFNNLFCSTKIFTKKHNLKNKITLIKSPFHYKTSKSIINTNKQYIFVNILCNVSIKQPLFFAMHIKNFLITINQNNLFVLKSCKFKQIHVKNKKLLYK